MRAIWYKSCKVIVTCVKYSEYIALYSFLKWWKIWKIIFRREDRYLIISSVFFHLVKIQIRVAAFVRIRIYMYLTFVSPPSSKNLANWRKTSYIRSARTFQPCGIFFYGTREELLSVVYIRSLVLLSFEYRLPWISSIRSYIAVARGGCAKSEKHFLAGTRDAGAIN